MSRWAVCFGVALGVLVVMSVPTTFGADEAKTPDAKTPDAKTPDVKTTDVKDAITLLSPHEMQVSQRLSRNQGMVLLSGRVKGDLDKLEVRFTGKSAAGDLPDKWEPLQFSAAGKSFTDVKFIPAGGWYKVEVRATRGGQPVGMATVDKLGVGEVFVIAGQSNSTNSGQFTTKQTSGMVSSFGGQNWKLADDPQDGVKDKSTGGSPWPAFGDAMYAKYKVPIGIASTGFGGTSVKQWQPDANEQLFPWSLTRVLQLGPGGFRAVLWHQGESDVGMATDEYVAKLTTVIHESKKRAGWEFPWFVAQVSYHNAEKPKDDAIRNAHKQLWDTGVAHEGPDTDTLPGDNRDQEGKGIHFSPKGLKAHGEMWAEKVGVYLDKVLAESKPVQ